MSKPKSGDRVKVRAKQRDYVGVLMPRPGLVSGQDVVMKLDSGYNIGLKSDDIEKIEVLKTVPVRASSPKKPLPKSSKKPKLSILSTGGTISSKIDYASGGVSASFTAQDLFDVVPEVVDYADVSTRSIMNAMSEDMNPRLWVEMAKEVYAEFKGGADGVVVTHGTDTMHYSSAALSFLLPNCPKPLVFTGSQRSTDRGSSDASLNLLCSVITATSDMAGVHLCMHGSMDDNYCLVHNGTRVRKMHTTRRDAFKSINTEPLAKVFPNGRIEYTSKEYRKCGEGVVVLDEKINSKVGFVKAYPGMPTDLIDFYVKKGVKGLVIEGTALGHVPTTIKETSLIPSIEVAIKKGVVVCMSTQCLFGRVHPLVYSNLRELSSRGVVYCKDMLPETTYVKLMWVLGHTKDPQKAAEMMLTDYVGEISERTEPEKEFL